MSASTPGHRAARPAQALPPLIDSPMILRRRLAADINEAGLAPTARWWLDVVRAYRELIPALLEMTDYYAEVSAIEHPRSTAGKVLERISRNTRPEVELEE